MAAGRHRFLDHPGPIAFAHRGGAGEHPENTLAAFETAVGLGYLYLETDVHLTADGVLVAFHDDRLDRLTDRSGRIAELPWATVREAKVHGTHPIPVFEDLLGAWPDVRFNVDPKADRSLGPLLETIQRCGALERVCVGSFSDRRLAQARVRLGPRLCTGLGPRGVARLRAAAAGLRVGHLAGACAQVPLTVRGVPLVDERFVREAHRRDISVHVWTIDDPAEMHRLLDLGVDGIMTDRPAVLRDVLEQRGCWVGR